MANLTLKQLRAVAMIARCGTLTRAAAEMHVTPAALTARLKQIEDELGILLFSRTSGGLISTEAGRTMLGAAEAVETVLERCVEQIDVLRGVRGGRVAVGVVSTGKYFAPMAVAAFGREYPGIEIRLVVGNRKQIIEALREYRVDLAIMGRPSSEFPTEHRTLGEHPMVIAAAPEHPLASRERIALAELASERFLVREPDSGSRTVYELLADRISPDRPRIAMEIDSNETIKQAVIAGLGIALISAHTIESELKARRLVVLNVEGLPIRRHWLLVRRADHSLGPGAHSFWDFMLREGQGLLPRLSLRSVH
ncbi:LysR family transcriptional regulator [Sinimarinibacterium flocculans]|uniref:DNA-binding transcriptional LysR family regulator n=1 Tax=Sinimarinibacterium flocculans TaxID=985250 RepID=A0A318E3E8_9GAMM|nr:LysR family transcriptional regulator [Sinimarinibacterium flocculans]PXV65652.1 DNA-binding transcriptional LysR family regulator [Sinimarinibacterium flocculans]